MNIVTTYLNGKEAFSAQVEHKGTARMVYGFVPPASKSTYLMVGEGGVAIPDVPDDIAKTIYSKLKRGEAELMPTINYPRSIPVSLQDYVMTLPVDVRSLILGINESNDTHITVQMHLWGGVAQLILFRYKYRESCIGYINYPLENPIALEASNDILPVADWGTWHFTPNHYKVIMDKVPQIARGDVTKVLQSLAPYIIQHQYDYIPKPEDVFKGYTGRTYKPLKSGLEALRDYLQGAGTAIYVGTELYSGSKEFPKSMSTMRPSIDKNALVIACSNVEAGYRHLDFLSFTYGDVISENDIQGSVYKKRGLDYLFRTPTVINSHYGDIQEEKYSNVTGRPLPASSFKRELVYSNLGTEYKLADGTHPFDKFLSDDRFYKLVDSIQKNAR